MPDLKTLQYPRHVHKDGSFRVVASAAECDEALDAGWVLSPGDSPRAKPSTDTFAVGEPVTLSGRFVTADDSLPEVADVPEPDAPTRRKAPKKSRS